MPYPKKRRVKPAPNKNNAKVQRRESLEQSDSKIETLFPFVERLSIQFDVYDARGNHLDQRSQALGPQDRLALQIDCMGPCGNGRINLEGKFLEMIQKQEAIFEGRAKCAQTLYAGSSDACGYELRCRAEVRYK